MLALLTPGFWTLSLQNCERTHFCCSESPTCSTLLWQSEKRIHDPSLGVPGLASHVDHDISLLTVRPAPCPGILHTHGQNDASKMQTCPEAQPVPATVCSCQTQNSSRCSLRKWTQPAGPSTLLRVAGSIRPVHRRVGPHWGPQLLERTSHPGTHRLSCPYGDPQPVSSECLP